MSNATIVCYDKTKPIITPIILMVSIVAILKKKFYKFGAYALKQVWKSKAQWL